MDDARRAVEAAQWDAPWGADADHLKTVDDLPPFVEAGYTFFTVDPGEYVDNAADTDSLEVLKQKVAASELGRTISVVSALETRVRLGGGLTRSR